MTMRVLGMTMVAAALAVACGGGGGGSDPGTPAAATVQGVVATGAPIAGARVEVLCAAGSPAAVTADAAGRYSVAAAGITFPCVAVAGEGTVRGAASGDVLHAVVLGAGTANITSLTSLQLAYLLRRDLAAWLAAARADRGVLASALGAQKLADALATLKAQLAALPTPLSLPEGFDPVRTACSADGADGADKLLDALLAALAAGGGSLADAQVQAAAALPLVERTPATLALTKIGGFTHTGGVASAEITAYDPLSKRPSPTRRRRRRSRRSRLPPSAAAWAGPTAWRCTAAWWRWRSRRARRRATASSPCCAPRT